MSKVSIIIPTYNSGEYILESVDSALSQIYEDKEVIVVDDGSTDRTRTVLDEYVSAGKIRYFYQDRSGVAKARNFGLSQAGGELVAFLDADDVWKIDKLERQIKLFVNSTIGLVYSDMEFFGVGRLVGKRFSDIARLRRGRVIEELIGENFISTSTVVTRRELVNKVGGFDEEFSIGEDYALWLKIARIASVDFSAEALVQYRIHAKQSSESAYKTYKSMARLWKKLAGDPGFGVWEARIKQNYRKSLIKMIIRRIWPAHGVEA